MVASAERWALVSSAVGFLAALHTSNHTEFLCFDCGSLDKAEHPCLFLCLFTSWESVSVRFRLMYTRCFAYALLPASFVSLICYFFSHMNEHKHTQLLQSGSNDRTAGCVCVSCSSTKPFTERQIIVWSTVNQNVNFDFKFLIWFQF